jgi:hypothetical protein
MNVRNFWVSADIEGRGTQLSGGPLSKSGGFDQAVYIRDNGEAKRALSISGEVRGDELELFVSPGKGVTMEPTADGGFVIRTKR